MLTVIKMPNTKSLTAMEDFPSLKYPKPAQYNKTVTIVAIIQKIVTKIL